MNWEAFAVIGAFALLLGIVLYIPGRWWARRKLHDASLGSPARASLTPIGYVVIGLLVFALVGTFSLKDLAPDSLIGRIEGSRVGRLTILVCMASAFWLVESIAKRLGIDFIRLFIKADDE
jgi:hypothetical protein